MRSKKKKTSLAAKSFRLVQNIMKRKSWRTNTAIKKSTIYEWEDKPADRWGECLSYCRPSPNVQLYISGHRQTQSYMSDIPEGTIYYQLSIYAKGNSSPIWTHPDISYNLELAKQDLEDIYYNLYPPLRGKK